MEIWNSASRASPQGHHLPCDIDLELFSGQIKCQIIHFLPKKPFKANPSTVIPSNDSEHDPKTKIKFCRLQTCHQFPFQTPSQPFKPQTTELVVVNLRAGQQPCRQIPQIPSSFQPKDGVDCYRARLCAIKRLHDSIIYEKRRSEFFRKGRYIESSLRTKFAAQKHHLRSPPSNYRKFIMKQQIVQ